ncbi:MAG TPA: PQQ-binding-like beta-propeller repeat protein [Candidatus Eremiobacteraceae bacterium]
MNWIRATTAITTIVSGIIAGVAPTQPALADWPVFDRDPARSGFAAGDTAISLANVRHLHRRWVATYDATADGAPILIANVPLSANSTSPVLYQETRLGTTYAVNAYSGEIVWKRTTQGVNITSSMPAADPSGQWIYAPGVDAHVRKYAAATGKEFRGNGFPLRITWSPEIEKDASALNVANGYLYAETSGYFGDAGQYDGHVVTLGLQSGHVHVVNALCNDIHHLIRTPGECAQTKAGIWARGGAVVDPDPSMAGRIYVSTGNGDFNANQGGHDYGDSVLAISANGSTLVDTFTPTNYQQLENGDVDLSSSAPVMLPKQPASNTPLMAVQGGKDGLLKLLNRKHLGGVGGELQDYNLNEGIFTAPAVWTDRDGTTWLFVGSASAVTALQLVTVNGRSTLQHVWTAQVGGTSPVVANGIVFAATSGAVNAFNARTGHEVWSSSQQSAGGSIGNVHWESPIVVRGWLYMSDENGNVTAYSL